MFDFLREVRDNVAADLTIAIHGLKHTPAKDKVQSVADIEFDENKDYLNAMGYKYGNIYPTMMKKIITNNLQHLDPEVIAAKLNISLYTPERIRDILEAYRIMNFLKEKGYSADEAGVIMQAVNIYEANKEKPLREVCKLAKCTMKMLDVAIMVVANFKDSEAMNKQQHIFRDITEHKDFGKKNPVDIGVECGYSEEEVIELIRSLEQETKENE